MKFVAFVVIMMIALVSAAPEPHKIGFGGIGVAVAEPVVPVPVYQVPRIVPIVQPVVQPIVPVVQSYYPVVPIVGVGRFG